VPLRFRIREALPRLKINDRPSETTAHDGWVLTGKSDGLERVM
jgi:hypothetical protein